MSEKRMLEEQVEALELELRELRCDHFKYRQLCEILHANLVDASSKTLAVDRVYCRLLSADVRAGVADELDAIEDRYALRRVTREFFYYILIGDAGWLVENRYRWFTMDPDTRDRWTHLTGVELARKRKHVRCVEVLEANAAEWAAAFKDGV